MIKKATNISAPHAFSTRLGGVSCGEFSSLNLGFQYGDNPSDVAQNWSRFSRESGVDTSLVAAATQVHKADVAVVKAQVCISPEKYANGYINSERPVPIDKLHHIYKFSPLCEVDGLVTCEQGVTLAIFTADCASLLMYDSKSHVSAALHCGWKSFTGDIIANGLYAMKTLGAEPEHIQAAIGPCIGKCCFEVGAEVAQAFRDLLGNDADRCLKLTNHVERKYHADLRQGVKARLTQLGIPLLNISQIDECTSCNNETYFSYRKENGHCGRLASAINNS